MYTETLFHGSNRKRGNKIISTQKMIPSEGDKHWLGDGSYFFTEDFYSYKWIVDMFKSRYKELHLTYGNLTRYYLILKANVTVQKNRILDLTKAEHKILFDKVYDGIKSKRQIDDDYAEGIVINYMFNELPGYREEFDLVKALFTFNKRAYIDMRTRIGYMPQEQICIKNKDVVKDIVEFDFKSRVEKFESLLNNYYF